MAGFKIEIFQENGELKFENEIFGKSVSAGFENEIFKNEIFKIKIEIFLRKPISKLRFFKFELPSELTRLN